jgi:poly(3-hydroxybutyrate) depolymerase
MLAYRPGEDTVIVLRSSRVRATVLARSVALVSVVLSALVGIPAAQAAGALPRLAIAGDYVSGISSGGYMATQLQVAYSSRFAGAGIFSAGPYYCGQDSVVIALEACTSPQVIPDDLQASIDYTDRQAAAGTIDPTSNLAHQRTWFFHGTQDTVVAPKVADDLAAYYRHYGVPLTYRNTDPAGHAWISPLGPNPCPANTDPYINNCGFDAEAQMLSTMFGAPVNPPNTGPLHGTVQAFSQDPYAVAPQPGAGDVTRTGAAAIGMGPTGYVYVPNTCTNGQKCRLVLSLHGCLQTATQIGTTFVTDAYLNQYADTNKLVVLYPQAEPDATLGNPKGCWDWWGYLGAADGGYATRTGPQMVTVMNMVHALGG